ncbi:16S rRNA (guanine(966)-N(2))-methyltransferase RsmD [Aquibacillus koreensis]|uniref:16S rRNA (Guanine(966)-N(2))-methyltransferase RsmD n=1 Tax=Aquibacillus koreensis TaxID=279446 RepID=A0A9X3WIX6_9BACI|nr:16S rRNA (guanine(966)-N(2))-methyltransferase RsmD [Aquibacillus koreensis]MCT2538079.1 16S rRNA (guanine(966)-N(2))-methyltransferase RsmD [Aquibacillus koreensis]MDC3420602.1 16S rRNA (guanine(966)-N(2))-methyltransferase RsmD [Aquibacillus koreensis]
MRVISGEFKGHPLKPVPNRLTRPTTDKVKEALFQMIGPYFNGGSCFDLFAGSGGLGIEALSRGMDRAVFVDNHPKAIQTIHSNLQSLKIENRSEVFRTDAFRAIKAAGKRGLIFSFIFLDPPYEKVSYEKLLNLIYTNQLLEKDGTIVCEHEANQTLSSDVMGFSKIRTEMYGSTTAITLYKLEEK